MLSVWLVLLISLRVATISPMDITISRIICNITASVIVTVCTVTVQAMPTK